MFNIELLEKLISKIVGKDDVLNLAAQIDEHQIPLRSVIDLTFHATEKIAFRASWILENVLKQNAVKYTADLPYLLQRFPQVEYASSQRHYANIMIVLTSAKAAPEIKHATETANMEPVIEKLFDWLIDPKVLVAVKCSSAEALLHLSKRENWIKDELRDQVEHLMHNGSAAMQARGKMILSKLHHQELRVQN